MTNHAYFEPVILFFLLGAIAGFVRSDLKIPGVLYESLSIFLLLAIGLKGGAELARYPLLDVALPALTVVAVGALIPLAAFPVLRHLGKLSRADAAKVRQALMGGFAASRILEVHGERMIRRTFNRGFRIGLHQKDLSLALAGARSLGVALPQTAGAAQLMQVCAANGMQDLDHSALVRSLEIMANHTVA